MHEMAVTQHLLNLALEHAQGQPITDLYLDVGQMAAIEPQSVEIFFIHLSKDTLAEGARLHFNIIPIEMTCQDCGEPVDLSEWLDLLPQAIMARAFAHGCGACGGKNLRVTGGVAFDLVRIEVEVNDERA